MSKIPNKLFEVISSRNFSESLLRKFEEEMRKIFDDDEFVYCNLHSLRSDEDLELILEYIEEHPNVTSADIIYACTAIAEYYDENA